MLREVNCYTVRTSSNCHSIDRPSAELVPLAWNQQQWTRQNRRGTVAEYHNATGRS